MIIVLEKKIVSKDTYFIFSMHVIMVNCEFRKHQLRLLNFDWLKIVKNN